jgi:hypothetical protein
MTHIHRATPPSTACKLFITVNRIYDRNATHTELQHIVNNGERAQIYPLKPLI